VAADRVRLEEAAPRRAELVVELGKLDEQLARTPEVPAWRHSVSPDMFERLLRENVDIARGRVERIERTLAELDVATRAAADAEKRLGELLSKGQALAGALADAEKVAADLGRDGLQALELDAAGPELSVLATDLLHRAFGPRWTVSFETLRSSADGKRELETLEVRVLDTHTGYEGPVEALSGGERAIVGEAVSLALTVLACRSAGLEAPTLVRDESGAALDPAKSEAYVRMLRIAAELVGASRVLFVSHDPRAAELADSRIEIVDGVIVVGAARAEDADIAASEEAA
jgi:exonuclease SbcC